MGAREHREPDDVHVFLDRRLHYLVRRPLEAGVDDFDPGVTQRLGHDLRAAVVPVEPGLRDQHLHAKRNAGSQRAAPPGSSATRRGESRTALPIATFAGSASTRIENTRRPSIFTIANTRGPWKPAGSPVSCTVNAWTVPSPERSTQSNWSAPHSPQNARGGHARRRHPAHRVVASRPAASRV